MQKNTADFTLRISIATYFGSGICPFEFQPGFTFVSLVSPLVHCGKAPSMLLKFGDFSLCSFRVLVMCLFVCTIM